MFDVMCVLGSSCRYILDIYSTNDVFSVGFYEHVYIGELIQDIYSTNDVIGVFFPWITMGMCDVMCV